MKEIKPSGIGGSVCIPASKSVVQRAVAAAMLARGTSVIHNPSRCNDCLAALSIAKQMGATVVEEPNRWTITGNFKPSESELSCGEAGLSIRMFTPIVATLPAAQRLTGHGSLTSRPMGGLEEAIVQLGAKCSTTAGLLPITVEGPIKGGSATIDGSLSSQILTGVLMAAPMASQSVDLEVVNLKSRPYIDMTIEVMAHFGVKVKNSSYQKFFVEAGQSYQAAEVFAEGDWSGAAFFLVAGVIAGDLTVTNITSKSKQADKTIVDAIIKAGGQIAERNGGFDVSKSSLKAFSFDATNCPDLFPPLAVLAAACKGTTLLKGVSRLTHKESNRALALQNELTKAGIAVEIEGDEMYITGGTPKPCSLNSYNDHRMAMMAGILGLIASGPISVSQPECVAKSYSEFWDHLSSIIV